MAKPPGALVIKWRDLAAEGMRYAEIQRRYPEYTVHQIRHYCRGNTGKALPGPRQKAYRGPRVWLQGERSPHASLTREQAIQVLDDYDEEAGRWRRSGREWSKLLGVSESAIHQLRRGDTWAHLNHPNQGK